MRGSWSGADDPCYGPALEEEKRGEEYAQRRRSEQIERDARLSRERGIDAAIERAYAAQAARRGKR